jgi:FdrA protein
MTVRRVQVRREYRDSVSLMQLSALLQDRPGVSAALVAMATDVNLSLAATMGFDPPSPARPDDMLVAVAADSPSTLDGAFALLDAELVAPVAQVSWEGVPPRTVGSAVRRAQASVVLVSTPGRYAFLDALDALEAGASVMVFSDNVPVEQEVALKTAAAARGLLVMGPDCGTAVVGGVGLGFANVVRPGPVGLVAASGTGAQQVMSLLDAAGVGISHCLGVGGRDLSAPVAGRSTLAALDLLDADPATELILVISKPPAPAVAAEVRAHASGLATDVRFALLGPDEPDLTAAVTGVLGRLGRPVPAWPVWRPATTVPSRGGTLLGLFCGGTLRDEASVVAGTATTAELIDLGADEYTRGRPHPMIDPSVRLDRLAAAARHSGPGTVLVDVVLGHGADPDPAGSLAPALRTLAGAGVPTVVSLTGTSGDPQGRDRQASVLCSAGATVFLSNAEAARYALEVVAA